MEKFITKKRFKILLILISLMPAYSSLGYPPEQTSNLIVEVLSNPLTKMFVDYNIISKLLLFLAALIPYFNIKNSEKYTLGYYVLILIFVGFFQNASFTESYGFSIITGNVTLELIVIITLIYDLLKNKTKFSKDSFHKERVWIVPLMILALLMPCDFVDNTIIPSLSLKMFINDAGFAYCMITPVIIGTYLLFEEKTYVLTLYIISFIGTIFGFYNMLTWFVFNIKSYWMGVLHLPLVIISIYGMLISKKSINHNI